MHSLVSRTDVHLLILHKQKPFSSTKLFWAFHLLFSNSLWAFAETLRNKWIPNSDPFRWLTLDVSGTEGGAFAVTVNNNFQRLSLKYSRYRLSDYRIRVLENPKLTLLLL